MREIKKVDAGQTPSVKVEKAGNAAESPSSTGSGYPTNENLETGPNSLVGQAQVVKDNTSKDLHFMMENPDAVAQSEKLFNLAFKSLQEQEDPQAYEKACAISTSAAKELFS